MRSFILAFETYAAIAPNWMIMKIDNLPTNGGLNRFKDCLIPFRTLWKKDILGSRFDETINDADLTSCKVCT